MKTHARIGPLFCALNQNPARLHLHIAGPVLLCDRKKRDANRRCRGKQQGGLWHHDQKPPADRPVWRHGSGIDGGIDGQIWPVRPIRFRPCSPTISGGDFALPLPRTGW